MSLSQLGHLMPVYSGFLLFLLIYIKTHIGSGGMGALTVCYGLCLKFGNRSCWPALQHYFETNSKRHYSALLPHRLKAWSHLGTAHKELQAKSGMNLSKEQTSRSHFNAEWAIEFQHHPQPLSFLKVNSLP